LKHALPQALKRDGYRCMISGKLDSATIAKLEGTNREASNAALDAREAAEAASADPSDPHLAQKAAESAKTLTKLNARAKRANAILSEFPASALMCPTNAAHIFPESTNRDLSKDTKVRYSLEL
jgi:hypothetical protein